MPQINRVRIINFSYNNNNRNIIDEIFNFYQGENALLSLKNGGGKSVLVQLLLQPIIPKAKLMGRRMEDFFKGRKTPSYVLIEWKLEDQGGYLLTGIGLTNREHQVRDQDEEVNNSVKYFTFTSYYRESNLFDIENISLIKKLNERIYIGDFKNARKLISEKAKDRDCRVRLFTDEEGMDYRGELESYNIFPDEWKSIILKINESEGGVIEIFEKCKTSQQLMNNWILKTIEKVVNKEERDQKKLELMLENLVEEMISNEQFIHEKELYQGFLRETEEYLDQLNDLIKSLDNEAEMESNIASMYYFLKNEINKMDDELRVQNDKIADCEKGLKRIDLEERSKEYYDQLDNVNSLAKSLEEAEAALASLQEKIDLNKKEILGQLAARDYGRIKEIKQTLAGIKAEIDKIKHSAESKAKIRNLEYSLKIAYASVLEQLKKNALAIEAGKGQKADKIKEADKEIDELDRESSELQNKKGRVDSKIEQFEKDEQKKRDELALIYERNLLGEIEKDYFDQYILTLEENMVALAAERSNIEQKIDDLLEETAQANVQMNFLRESMEQRRVEAARLEDKISAYNDVEAAIKPIFARYDLDFSKRFNHRENHLFIEKIISELQKRERGLDLTVMTLRETIASLENGTLHVSKEFRQWLINNDIDFQTGENYLRKQNLGIRNSLVEQNPILPFAFLLYDDDIEKLKSMDMALKINQMVPILSYSDINKTYSVDGNAVYLGKQLQFICLYDNRMIDADSLDAYLQELHGEMDKVTDQLTHYRGELTSARDALQVLRQFDFDKNYLYDLEREKGKLENQVSSVRSKIEDLETRLKEISESINNKSRRINEIDRQRTEEAAKKEKLNQFIVENDEYLENRRLSGEYVESIERINRKKAAVAKDKQNFIEEKEALVSEDVKVGQEIKGKEDRLSLYADAEAGEQLDQDIDIMEAELQALKHKITYDLERLERDFENKKEELQEKEELLASYQLEESQYCHIVYDPKQLKELSTKVSNLKEEHKKSDKKCRDVEGDLREAKGKLASAENEVKKLAELPLEPALVKLNFAARRKEKKEDIVRAKSKITELGKISKEYDTVANKIAGQIEVERYEVNAEYRIKQGIQTDFAECIKELKHCKAENSEHEKNAMTHYTKVKARYESKNKHIENILAGLEPLIEAAQGDKDKYFYLGERMLISNESLTKLIKACEQRLANVEKNKRDMIQHSYLHAKQVYDEVQKIAENSSIKLEGKTRPIPMLKIDMDPLSETEEENRTKMKGYIENCVGIIKRDMKEEKKIEEIRKKISKYMSTKELLNVLSDLGKMNISAYKIDINVKNNRYKSWEQVMKENSGGERFVSFFAVLVALISYTRTSMKSEDDYQRNKDTKVLIMDNPFGPISSEHLLKPLFRIAEKYNTQLICLTDLKQNSILNCFNLIYMIKIRQNVFGTKEYIQLEQQIKEDIILKTDERLEKAVFKAEDVEQINLFN